MAQHNKGKQSGGQQGGEGEKVNPIQVQKFLKGVDYPVSRDDLVEHARSNGADERVCALLERLGEDEFQTPAEVSQAIGEAQ